MLFDGEINLRLLLLGSYPQGVLGGLALNLLMAVTAFATSFVIGHGLALARASRIAPLRWASSAYIELVRAVPLLIVLFWFFFSIPLLLQSSPDPLLTGYLALTAYASAYQAEYIRAGMAAVSRGELEAARSLGLRPLAILWQIVLPQAHRRMLPSYASYFTSLFKDSSALYLLGLVDLMQTGLIAAERQPDRMLQAYLTVGTLFFIVCWSATRAARYLERRLSPRSPPPRQGPPHSPSRAFQEDQHAHA